MPPTTTKALGDAPKRARWRTCCAAGLVLVRRNYRVAAARARAAARST